MDFVSQTEFLKRVERASSREARRSNDDCEYRARMLGVLEYLLAAALTDTPGLELGFGKDTDQLHDTISALIESAAEHRARREVAPDGI